MALPTTRIQCEVDICDSHNPLNPCDTWTDLYRRHQDGELDLKCESFVALVRCGLLESYLINPYRDEGMNSIVTTLTTLAHIRKYIYPNFPSVVSCLVQSNATSLVDDLYKELSDDIRAHAEEKTQWLLTTMRTLSPKSSAPARTSSSDELEDAYTYGDETPTTTRSNSIFDSSIENPGQEATRLIRDIEKHVQRVLSGIS